MKILRNQYREHYVLLIKMRYLSIIAVLFALGVQTEWQTLLWVTYYADTDLFASHCENPQNSCCIGKCQVEKADAKNHKDNGTLVRISPLQPCIISITVYHPPILSTQLLTFTQNTNILSGYHNIPDEPPRG